METTKIWAGRSLHDAMCALGLTRYEVRANGVGMDSPQIDTNWMILVDTFRPITEKNIKTGLHWICGKSPVKCSHSWLISFSSKSLTSKSSKGQKLRTANKMICLRAGVGCGDRVSPRQEDEMNDFLNHLATFLDLRFEAPEDQKKKTADGVLITCFDVKRFPSFSLKKSVRKSFRKSLEEPKEFSNAKGS